MYARIPFFTHTSIANTTLDQHWSKPDPVPAILNSLKGNITDLPPALRYHVLHSAEEDLVHQQCQIEHYLKFYYTLFRLVWVVHDPWRRTPHTLSEDAAEQLHDKRVAKHFRLPPPDSCLYPYVRACLRRAALTPAITALDPKHINPYPKALSKQFPLPIARKPAAPHIAFYHYQRFKKLHKRASDTACASLELSHIA